MEAVVKMIAAAHIALDVHFELTCGIDVLIGDSAVIKAVMDYGICVELSCGMEVVTGDVAVMRALLCSTGCASS